MLYQHHRSQDTARRNLRIRWSSNMKIAKAFGMTVPAMMDAAIAWLRELTVQAVASDRRSQPSI
jgi:hypothetical protein